jgi:nucleoside-diphosphate-sugar epimerase
LDAADADALLRVVDGARTLFNCAMPRYDRWPQEFPALAAGMLAAAERTGVDYVMLGNVYGYGPVGGRVAESTPLAPASVKGRIRARIWEQALEAHTSGRIRATEVRASDFLGHGAYSIYNLMVTPNVLAGSPAYYPGDPDVAHSWTYTEDAARALIAASRSESAWGKPWHVPPCSHLSARELTDRLAAVAQAPSPQLIRMTAKEVMELGRTDSIIAEVEEMLYLFESPFQMSAIVTASALSLQPSPLSEVLRDTVRKEPQR